MGIENSRRKFLKQAGTLSVATSAAIFISSDTLTSSANQEPALSQYPGQLENFGNKKTSTESVFQHIQNFAFLFQAARVSAQSAPPEQYTLVYKNYLPMVSKPGLPFFAGLGFSPYRDGQNPNWGPYPTQSQILEDLHRVDRIVLDNYTNQGLITAIRTYGVDHGFDNIPSLASQNGIPLAVNVGCWLDGNLSTNETQISHLIAIANANPNVNVVTVGNETQLFGTVSERQLIQYVDRVKREIRPGVLVTTGDSWYKCWELTALFGALDIIEAQIFPYWEVPNPIPVLRAVEFIAEKIELLKQRYPDKQVIVGETGWPSAGEARGEAVPSLPNFNLFLSSFCMWAEQSSTPYYLFEAFDENWKKSEGEVGAHWGIYNSNRTRKPYTLGS